MGAMWKRPLLPPPLSLLETPPKLEKIPTMSLRKLQFYPLSKEMIKQ